MDAKRQRGMRALQVLAAVVLVVLAGGAGWVSHRTRDRTKGYQLALTATAAPAARPAALAAPVLRVGFADVVITPQLIDRVNDADGNARYQPDKGDTYEDVNQNGELDALWLAGFHNNRPATGIHDDLYANAVVLDDGTQRLALVGLDAIGFFFDEVVEVRQRLQAEWGIQHVVVASSHCHEVPDLMGIWGPSELQCGVNPAYREQVISGIVKALGQAVGALAPATLTAVEVPGVTAQLVRDSRQPEVGDPGVRVLWFRTPDKARTLGTVVSWSNHPETLWSGNTQLTADFVGYLRDGVKDGIRYDTEVKRPGLGGSVVYLNGCIGGLLTPGRSSEIHDPWLNQDFQEPSFEKARAIGYRVADAVLSGVESAEAWDEPEPKLSVKAKLLELKVDNKLFLAAPVMGVIRRGFAKPGYLKSEVDLLTIGSIWLATVPGELYPEIANGGVEHPPGADFELEPVEVPSLRAQMKGRMNLVIGLANDEVGYIIPQSEWDSEGQPPYLYGAEKSPYGEVNSLGPETGPAVHRAVSELCASHAASEG